jgi:hypothetical protein
MFHHDGSNHTLKLVCGRHPHGKDFLMGQAFGWVAVVCPASHRDRHGRRP